MNDDLKDSVYLYLKPLWMPSYAPFAASARGPQWRPARPQ